MSKAPQLDQATLRAILHYDPPTGVFTWLVRSDVRPQWNGRYARKRAGYEWTADGGRIYRYIRIFDWPFAEHRLAVLYMTGAMPPADVDHEDTNGLNNAWSNLRLASKSQNGANRGASRRSKSGMKGVTFDRRAGRWRATIGVNKKQHWLGSFDTPESAQAAYEAAAIQHFGEFARTT